MNTPNETRIKISDPQRIARILRRICQASLPVVVRSESSASTSVKGRVSAIIIDSSSPGVRISNISEKGIAYLKGNPKVQVEFVMMATKVVFTAKVLLCEHNNVLVSLPTTLVSIERRKNARYACTDELSAYLDLSVWHPDANDPTTPPFYPHVRSLATYISIADLSFGGLCAVTRFPAVSNVLKRGLMDDHARLILPMQAPLTVGIEVRWVKRIKELDKTNPAAPAYMRFYRFGIEFSNPNEQVRISIRQFIQQISQAGAI